MVLKLSLHARNSSTKAFTFYRPLTGEQGKLDYVES